ncbi:MAG TPA: Rv2175c family DNA-binding protein [Longimicrobiaceae bacterium]
MTRKKPRMVREQTAEIVDFSPDAASVTIRYQAGTGRYLREKSPEQMVTMGDYHRARRGFSSDQEMAEILGVHRTRLAAWKQGSALPGPENAQLLSHVAVVVEMLDRFLDPDVIADWLLTEQFSLGGRTPVDALRAGRLAEVLQAVNAMEHGAYV